MQRERTLPENERISATDKQLLTVSLVTDREVSLSLISGSGVFVATP